jgi:pimeloyl-ACP methyl ester carboxylesterase
MECRLFGSQPAWSEPPTEADRAARQRNSRANAATLRPADGNADLLERLAEIRAPTLILWGTADEIIPSESSQLYVHRIPKSYRIFIFGAAHSLPVAAYHQFVTLATDFLQRGEGFVVNQSGGP